MPVSRVPIISATIYASVCPVAPKNMAISCSRAKPITFETMPNSITTKVASAIRLFDTALSLESLMNKIKNLFRPGKATLRIRPVERLSFRQQIIVHL